MKWYRVKFRMSSWTSSEWQSDTIFGHLCWGLRYLEGEDYLSYFLKDYCSGKPRLLLSNGFPGDYLPVPLPPLLSGGSNPSLEEQKRQYDAQKSVKNVKYISVADFNNILNGNLPNTHMKPGEELSTRRVTLKSQINRLSSTTGEGDEIFNFEEYYTPEISIYLKIEDNFVDEARKIFRYLADTGYGKRKSAGYGQISSFEFKPFFEFQLPPNPNAFVSLSNFVPAPDDPVNGCWQTLVKYGKMGEAYSLEENAFKKPFLMLTAGSIFYSHPLRQFYGAMVKNLNTRYPQSVQYALALPIPLLLHANI